MFTIYQPGIWIFLDFFHTPHHHVPSDYHGWCSQFSPHPKNMLISTNPPKYTINGSYKKNMPNSIFGFFHRKSSNDSVTSVSPWIGNLRCDSHCSFHVFWMKALHRMERFGHFLGDQIQRFFVAWKHGEI